MRKGRVRSSTHALAAALCAGCAVPAAAQATFPGTPGQILYNCSRSSEDTSHVCVINPDGSGNRRLVTNAGSPTWSPDGVHYAYIKAAPSELPGANPQERINLSNIDGRSLIRRLEPEDRPSSPVWAPDGLRLAFVDEGRGADQGDIWVTDLQNRRRDLTTGVVATDGDPEWSPDGRRIAFTSNREDRKNEIYTVDVESGAITRVTRSPERASSASPSWSPDGSQLAFVREQSSEETSAADLWVVGADGSGERAVTNYFGAGESGSGVSVFYPAWSPDGTRLVFSVDTPSVENSLRTIAADGTGEAPLGVRGAEPDWGPVAGSGLVQPLARPQVSALRLSRRAIWAAPPSLVRPTPRDGMTIRYRIGSEGFVQLGVQAVVRGRPRGKPTLVALLRARAGSHRLRWTGVYSNGVDVPRGTHRLVLIPFNPLGDTGRTVNSRTFRVLGNCVERRSRPCRPR